MPKKLILQPYARKQADMIIALLQSELFKAGFSRENCKLRTMGNRRDVFDTAVWVDKGQHEDILAKFTHFSPTVELIIIATEPELPLRYE